MNTSLKPVIVLFVGIFASCAGIWISFHAEEYSTKIIEGKRIYINGYDFHATPLIWLGCALVVLAFAAWLFSRQRPDKIV